jgi:hypothetical protein
MRKIFFPFLLCVATNGHSQGFVNLNFEQTKTTNFPSGYVSAVAPGWTSSNSIYTTLYSGNPSVLPYNWIALDSASVDVIGTNYFIPTLQGKYSILLQGGTLAYQQAYNTTNGASIEQTGQIPSSAQSMTYWGDSLLVSFNGQALSFYAISNTPNYTVWGADISMYAGQTGELMFTAPGLTEGMLDNIQFSANPLPEPSLFSILGIGFLSFGILSISRKCCN